MLVQTHPAPIIFLDTCAILDIPRSFYRELASSSLIPRSLGAVRAASDAPPKLHLIVTEGVDGEYAKNLPETLQDLQERIIHFSQVSLSLPSTADSSPLRSGLASIEKNLEVLTNQIHQSSRTIATEQACVSKARQRLSAGTAPGKRGSTNDADCIIIEHFLEFVAKLRALGFQGSCIFVSSNHRDFGRAPNPKTPLDSEFANLGIDYMGDIASAMEQAGLA